jgi:hypothetical protein
MRVLVCGGRDYRDRDHVNNELIRLNHRRGPFSVIIHGAATGADHEAMLWAEMMGIKHKPVAAEWEKLGKAAGPARNQRMIDEGKPELVIAFPGGSGTADCVRRAEKAGIEVIRIKPRRLTVLQAG